MWRTVRQLPPLTGGPALGGLTVHPIPGTDGTLLVGKQSGRCADVHDNTITNGTQAELWDCNGQDNEKWNVDSDGTLTNVHAGLCLDAYHAGTGNGTSLVLGPRSPGRREKLHGRRV
ncbi:RICIN domain-containing protein [Streptomyces incarnatus]